MASKTKSGPPSVRARSSATVAAGRRRRGSCRSHRRSRAVVQLGRVAVDGDQARGAGDHGAHDARQADAAEADDRDARAGRDTRGLEHGADTGRDAAADERGGGRVGAIGEGDRRGRGHDGCLGHGRDGAVGADLLPGVVATERGLAIEQGVSVRRRVGARPDLAPTTGAAHAARDEPRQRNELADTGRRHARTDGLDDAGALVAHDDRRRAIPLPVADVEVGVAHPRGQHPHEDLAGTWRLERQVADDGRGADPLEDRGPDRDPRHARHDSLDRRRSPVRSGSYGT